MVLKQVIVVRRDLKVRAGKLIAQCAHASMAFMKDVINLDDNVELTELQSKWLQGLHAKIVAQVDTLEEMLALHEKAKAAGLESHLVEDEGLTELHGVKTITALAIGPHESERFEGITDHLKLY
jgi:peptidyl-tRNA hydrolase, PTH2 family